MKKLIMSMLAAASLSVPALADDSKITKRVTILWILWGV